MRAPTLLPEDLDLQRYEQEEQRLVKELAQTRSEMQERENTMPPLERVSEITNLKRHEQELATRAQARNVRQNQTRSLLLLITFSVTAAALIAWGLRVMNG
jgi:hypothetical protein